MMMKCLWSGSGNPSLNSSAPVCDVKMWASCFLLSHLWKVFWII